MHRSRRRPTFVELRLRRTHPAAELLVSRPAETGRPRRDRTARRRSSRDVLDDQVELVDALARLDEIEAKPLVRPWFVRLSAYALAGAALTPVIGGGWRELIAGGFRRLSSVWSPSAPGASRGDGADARADRGIVASFTAAPLAELGLKASPDVVTLAALVTFLPGMALTIGVRELATEHLQSGVANTANALVQLLGLVFGVGVGRSIASSWFGVVHQVAPHAASRRCTWSPRSLRASRSP